MACSANSSLGQVSPVVVSVGLRWDRMFLIASSAFSVFFVRTFVFIVIARRFVAVYTLVDESCLWYVRCA